jgi:HAD superfamily hydrolase (TIGR01509 family)
MIKGVLFDMDGVLVDSETFICEAAVLMFRELGVKVSHEDFKPFVGMGENRYIGGVAQLHGVNIEIDEVKSRTYEIYGEIVKGKLKPLPGVHEFISKCIRNGFRLALATSADRIKMEINLKETGLSIDSFQAIITGLDVKYKKPSPEIYLKAAKSLGLKPENCLVVEDAVSGIESGKTAGCRCLAVTTSFPASSLGRADWICDSLLNVPEEVLNW